MVKKSLRQLTNSSKGIPTKLSSHPPGWRYRTIRNVLRWILKPTVTGFTLDSNESIVYVLERKSLLDLIVLDLVTQSAAPSPFSALESVDESRRFFFLFRSEGAAGKVTMYRFSERIKRIQQALLSNSQETQLSLVPVSIYWGRMNDKQGSLVRSLVSERRVFSARFRRVFGVLLSRSDLVVHFSHPIAWHVESQPDQTIARNLRHIARLVRTAFKQSREVVLGPELSRRSTLIRELVLGETQHQYTTSELRARKKIVKGMVSNQTYPAMRTLKAALSLFWRVTYDGIELRNPERLVQLGKSHTLIYTPNHRSHIDYLILSYLLFLNGIAIPHIAAGDNMNIPIVGALLRRCGAFFIRRQFREDTEYRQILNHYLKLLLSQGQSIEFFIEGSRSRSGWALDPQKGFVHALLASHSTDSKPLAFVPVQVSYERLVESESYQAELLGASKRSEGLGDIFRSLKLLTQNYGTITVSIGEAIEPQSLTGDVTSDSEVVKELADQVAFSINESAFLNATNLIAMTAFTLRSSVVPIMDFGRRLDFLRGLLRVDSLNHDFEVDARPYSELISRSEELELLAVKDDTIEITEPLLSSLAWYRNNTLHTLAIPSLVAVVVLAQEESVKRLDIVRQVAGLLPHVCGVLSVQLNLRDILRWLTHLRNAELIKEDEESIIFIPSEQSHLDSELRGLSRLIMPVLECMYATVTCLTHVPNHSLTLEQLIDQSMAVVQHAVNELDIRSLLVFDRRFFTQVTGQIQRYGLVSLSEDGKLAVNPSLAVIQRRATVAINPALRDVIGVYLSNPR